MFVLVPGDNLVDSCTAICPSEVRGCDRRLYRLSSRNPEAGWTLVKEPVACMGLSPGTLRLLVIFSEDSRSLLGTRRFNGRILGSNGTVVLLQNPKMLLGPEGRFWIPEAALDSEIAFRTRRLSEDPEVDGEPGEVLSDPEVAVGPGGYKEPGGLPFPDPEEICSGPGDCMGTRKFLICQGYLICILRDPILPSLVRPLSVPVICWATHNTINMKDSKVINRKRAKREHRGLISEFAFEREQQAWTMLEPGGESFFQMEDRGLDEYFQVLDLFEGDHVGFGTLILYFSGRQDLLSGLVTHVAGYMVLRPVTGPWRNGDLCCGVEATSLGGSVDLSLRTWRLLGTSALAHEDLYLFRRSSGRYVPWTYFLVDWPILDSNTGNFRFLQLLEGGISGFVAGKSGSKVVGACFFVEPLDFTPCKVGSRRPGTWIRDLGSGTWRIRRPARPNVEFAFFFGSFAGGREPVFPALGRDPFAEQLRWNLMSTKRRSIHPAIIFLGAILMTPPVFGIRPSYASVASRACYPLILMLVETAPGAEGNQILLKGDSTLGPGVGRNQRL
ncbi:hypothetical protein DY000_02030681 [Brassica cretica]|uniref:DUF295 domain-containing protein n=1 Tax=Brassica cretica TaxID=69181 RepID=A0ABQ7DYV4_BRACR|nr:hypothetical protein DY000_02030681 [Brassica cretica]